MYPRYRPNTVSLHVHEIRKLLPGRKLAHLTCPACGRRCQVVFAHPEAPDQWICKLCQRFTVRRNGRYALSELARARNALTRVAREHQRQVNAPETPTAAPPKRTRTAGPVVAEEKP